MSLGRCGKCKVEWSGLSMSHCGVCCEMFSSTAAFDRHRVDFECLPVERFTELMRKKDGSLGRPRLERAERGVWVTELGNWRKGVES